MLLQNCLKTMQEQHSYSYGVGKDDIFTDTMMRKEKKTERKSDSDSDLPMQSNAENVMESDSNQPQLLKTKMKFHSIIQSNKQIDSIKNQKQNKKQANKQEEYNTNSVHACMQCHASFIC